MQNRNTVDRRTVLKAAGGAAATGMVALAGCTDGGSGGDDGATVAVGPDGELRFDPAKLTAKVGDEVAWNWESDNHNIVVESQPDGADWGGTEGDDGALYDEGHKYSHTFETAGTYEYYCAPHKSAGMTATLTIKE